jgi:hypothetical protein
MLCNHLQQVRVHPLPVTIFIVLYYRGQIAVKNVRGRRRVQISHPLRNLTGRTSTDCGTYLVMAQPHILRVYCLSSCPSILNPILRRCNHIFCGYCLKLFQPKRSETAHSHVTSCRSNISPDRDLFADTKYFKEVGLVLFVYCLVRRNGGGLVWFLKWRWSGLVPQMAVVWFGALANSSAAEIASFDRGTDRTATRRLRTCGGCACCECF